MAAKYKPFRAEQSTHATGREPESEQQPNFANTLLEPQLEEQAAQQQSRDDDEEGEVCEVLTEVGRAS